jgi:putative acetyltransferase
MSSVASRFATKPSLAHTAMMRSLELHIRPFQETDAVAVHELFVTINRLLAPPELRDAFEAYIARSLTEEIDRITAYYAERQGGFWVAVRACEVVGMFGLEASASDAFELRRMYVAPSARRSGIARAMLDFAEVECRRRNARRLELSTSELQPAALELYRRAGYRLVREVIAEQASNKTLGGGIRRYYFEKDL